MPESQLYDESELKAMAIEAEVSKAAARSNAWATISSNLAFAACFIAFVSGCTAVALR